MSVVKMDWAKVRRMRRLAEQEGWTQGRLAREFGLGVAQVGKILRYEAWIEGVTEPEGFNTEGSVALVQKLLNEANAQKDATKVLNELERKDGTD